MKNKVGTVLQGYAIANALVGLIVWFYLISEESGIIGFMLFLAALVSGMLIFGFGEALHILQSIRQNTKRENTIDNSLPPL